MCDERVALRMRMMMVEVKKVFSMFLSVVS